MESAAVVRSFHCLISPLKSICEKPGIVPMNNVAFSNVGKFSIQALGYSGRLISSQNKLGGLTVSCQKTSEATVAANSNDSCQNGSVEKKPSRRATFPNGFEALVTEVCDDTEIAELKLKVGDFEMHLKRNIEATMAPALIESPTVAPPIPSEPMNESASVAPPSSPPKPSAEKVSPFTNVAAEKSAKLAALEASGATGFVLVSSPTVGSFRRAKTIKGKKQPPAVKEGDVIKEGQTIGFVDQFGTELPVRSDVAGEVLKLLYNDGEPVGFGDPLIAVLPSFHGIQ
ncbi:hypothetical protein M9H77_10793 [Catharanthus roseus]|uniref:Uncharacterized protein n=1 Tax=Catharanthus roseus TaxID=4058 RepID=A0ACC0BCN9_CATRO|nr:hypothetical protein M9H77_10793 [Catharanthus roseus]